MDGALPGTIGGTYGGNPVACAASLAAIEEIERLQLCQRANELGKKVLASFQLMQSQFPLRIGDVRGVGAMIAMEFVERGDQAPPASQVVAEVLQRCLENGLLILSAGAYANVIRFLAPLVITDEQLDQGLDILAAAVKQTIETHSVAVRSSSTH